MTSNDKIKKSSFFDNDRNRLAMFLVLAVAVAGLMFSGAGNFFLGSLSTVSAQEVPIEDENGEPGTDEEENGESPIDEGEFMMAPTAAAVDMTADKIVVSGSASSPGVEAGPFQILPILPERTDGKIYSGWISFTASAPIYVIPGYGFDAKNQTLNHDEFGELIRFASEGSFANNTLSPPELAHGPIMPHYSQISDSGIGTLPAVYSASVPFAGDLLEVGNINGTNFLISYTVVADVYETIRVSALEPAFMNTTGQTPEENLVSMVYGGVEKTDDAFSPNPITIRAGENVTWSNDDFLPHTVTSGTPDQMGTDEAGQEFDSGFVGTRSSFTYTFEDRGEFEYFCELHPNMVGTVIVR
jgi:plastocyanin